MAERKPISKKTRFDVFKRDKFTCQYCGRTSPDVILEVDHIKPVAEGGDNDMINLITSCRDCNRGKGKRKLDDDAELKKQQEQLKELAERKEQLEMMMQWREELNGLTDMEVEAVNNEVKRMTDGSHSLSPQGKSTVRRLLGQYTVNEIIEATVMAFERYYHGDSETCDEAIRKIGGICYNRKNQDDSLYFTNYLMKCARNDFPYEPRSEMAEFKKWVAKNIKTQTDFATMKKALNKSTRLLEAAKTFREMTRNE